MIDDLHVLKQFVQHNCTALLRWAEKRCRRGGECGSSILLLDCSPGMTKAVASWPTKRAPTPIAAPASFCHGDCACDKMQEYDTR